MSTDEPLYQIGICPYCPPDTQQQLLFAENECLGPYHESGKPEGYVRVRTLSLFRCEGCRAMLLYSTMLWDGDGNYHLDDIPNPVEWVIEQVGPEFLKRSTRPYSSRLFSTELRE